MRKNLGANPYVYPQPVLIVATYGEDGTADAMNVAYGGIVNSNRIQINIGVRHKTSDNIKLRNAFTVGIADEKNLVAADYVGIVSGHDVPDKLERSGFHTVKSEFVDAPVIEELPITLECRGAAVPCTIRRLVYGGDRIVNDEEILVRKDRSGEAERFPMTRQTMAYLRVAAERHEKAISEESDEIEPRKQKALLYQWQRQ